MVPATETPRLNEKFGDFITANQVNIDIQPGESAVVFSGGGYLFALRFDSKRRLDLGE